MKDIDITKDQIKECSGGRRIWGPFDEDENRPTIISRDLSKNQIVQMYSELYSAYFALYFENKELKESVDSLNSENKKLKESDAELNGDSFTEFVNALIDKRVKEKLRFGSDYYDHATLSYGAQEIGSVCLSEA